MKKKRTWIITGFVAALIAGGAFVSTRSTTGQAGSDQLAAKAQTATVTRTTLFTSVDSTGSIIPEADSRLVVRDIRHGRAGEGRAGRSGEEGRCPGDH